MIEHILKASLERNMIITIIYQKGGEITIRNIKVLDLDKEHVKAYCYLRKEKRIFKKENILSAAFFSSNTLKNVNI